MTSPLPWHGASEQASEEGGALKSSGGADDDVFSGVAQILKYFTLFIVGNILMKYGQV